MAMWQIALSFVFFGVNTFALAWKVTAINLDNSHLSEAAAFTNQNLPKNTVMLIDTSVDAHPHASDHLEFMFISEVTADLIMTQHSKNWIEIAKFFHKNGRSPYLMSKQKLDHSVLYYSDTALNF